MGPERIRNESKTKRDQTTKQSEPGRNEARSENEAKTRRVGHTHTHTLATMQGSEIIVTHWTVANAKSFLSNWFIGILVHHFFIHHHFHLIPCIMQQTTIKWTKSRAMLFDAQWGREEKKKTHTHACFHAIPRHIRETHPMTIPWTATQDAMKGSRKAIATRGRMKQTWTIQFQSNERMSN